MNETSPKESDIFDSKKYYRQELIQHSESPLSEDELERMVELIVEFRKGMSAMWEASQSRKHLQKTDHWRAPGFVLSFGAKSGISAYFKDTHEIQLNIPVLRNFVRKPIDEARKMGVSGFTFRAPARQMIFLAGAHEYRHALEEADPVNDEDMQSMAEYRAVPAEYRALGWEIFFAKKEKFSPEIIIALETMLKDAIQHRQKIELTTLEPIPTSSQVNTVI